MNSIRRVNGLEGLEGLEGPKDFVVLHLFCFPFHRRRGEDVDTVTPEQVDDGVTCPRFYFFLQHLLRLDAPAAAFYRRMAPAGRKFGSVIMYKQKGLATLEWGCVGGVYREKRGAVLYAVHTVYTRATWWLLVLPYVHVHTLILQVLFFPFSSYPTEYKVGEERK